MVAPDSIIHVVISLVGRVLAQRVQLGHLVEPLGPLADHVEAGGLVVDGQLILIFANCRLEWVGLLHRHQGWLSNPGLYHWHLYLSVG